MSFYEKFLTLIPQEINIMLLVKDLSGEKEFGERCTNLHISNSIEFIEFSDLFDIWIRDYAPLTTQDRGMLFPVKFKYAPSYVEKKYEKDIQNEHQIGKNLGEKYVSQGIRSVEFNWDMGNLTHNGAGTAIISNRLISDNETRNIDHELRSILHIFLGFSKIIFIPVEPGDVTGHVDGTVRFIDEKVLVVGSYPGLSSNQRFMDLLSGNLKEELGDDYTIIRLMNGAPEDAQSDGVNSAVGNHLNFLRINNLILFPYYNDQISKQAIQDFKSEIEKINLPIDVIPVDIPEINELARLGGVLNCISWHNFSEEKNR